MPGQSGSVLELEMKLPDVYWVFDIKSCFFLVFAHSSFHGGFFWFDMAARDIHKAFAKPCLLVNQQHLPLS